MAHTAFPKLVIEAIGNMTYTPTELSTEEGQARCFGNMPARRGLPYEKLFREWNSLQRSKAIWNAQNQNKVKPSQKTQLPLPSSLSKTKKDPTPQFSMRPMNPIRAFLHRIKKEGRILKSRARVFSSPASLPSSTILGRISGPRRLSPPNEPNLGR